MKFSQAFLLSISLTVTIFLLSACNEDETTPTCDIQQADIEFKRVGYLPTYRSNFISQINYEQLTHVNYAFLQANADGSLINIDGGETHLTELVALAHQQNSKVGIALGGWNGGDDSAFNAIASDAQITDIYVDNIVAFVLKHDLDGVDMDWEFPEAGVEAVLFEKLMVALKTALTREGKFLSVAVISGVEGTTANAISDTVLNNVDFVNVMAYDMTVDAESHSSFQNMVDAKTYWSSRCLADNKIVLGVPFYSRGSYVATYQQIVSNDPANACKDASEGRNYNGIPTMMKKTAYAQASAGGIMIWELGQDSDNEYSLLNAINNQITGIADVICSK